MTTGKKLWMIFGKAAACLTLVLAVMAVGGVTVRAEEGDPLGGGGTTPGIENPTGQGEGGPSQQQEEGSPLGAPAGGAGEPAGDPAPAITEEPYAVPEGSASFTDADGNEVTFSNDATGNAIQKAIEAAVTSAQNTPPANPDDKTQLTIVVDNGVYQGGIDLSVSAGGSFSEFITGLSSQPGAAADPLANISLNIVAKDALDGNNNPTANGAGGVVVEGDIAVEGLDVLLAGLYLSLNSKVSVVSTENFTYYGTQQDDHVDLSLKDVCGSLLVDTGTGDDSLQLAIEQLPDVQLDIDDDLYDALKNAENFEDLDTTDPDLQVKLQELEDQIITAITGRARANAMLEVLVKTNVGSNDISVYLKNSTRLAAANDGKRTLYLDVNRTVLDIYGGTGSDEILVAGGFANNFEDGLPLGAFRFAKQQAANETANSVTLHGGGGDNLFTVDTSLALASARGMEVTVDGSSGFDRLHLTGQLGNVANPIAGTASALTLQTATAPGGGYASLAGKLLVKATGVEAYTDLLAGKAIVTLSEAAAGGGNTAVGFTDYLLDLNGSDTVNFELDMIVPAALLLANLIVKGGDDLEIERLLAAGLNVVVLGRRIVITGKVAGANVLVVATGEDAVSFGPNFSIDTGDLTGKNQDIQVEFEFHEISTDARVELESTGSIEATGGVYITAATRQDKPTIPDVLGNSLNIFTLKIAEAAVELYGSIVAEGSVWAGSSTLVQIDTSNKTVKALLPFAVGAASTQSLVKVGGDASIESNTAGIKLTGKSDIEILSEAYSGMLAFALGLSVAETETRVVLGGNAALCAAGDVVLSAASRVRAESLAAGAKPEAGKSSATGVYVAVNVVVQDTEALVEDNASITAGGDIEVRSAARQFTNTSALSIPAQAGGSGQQEEDNPISFNKVLDLMKNVLAAPGTGKLDKAQGQVEGDNSPDKVLDDATDQAQDKTEGQQGSGSGQQEEKTSQIQLVGALAVNYGGNHNSALVNTTGSLLAGGAMRLQALGRTYAYARGDGSMYKTPKKDNGNSGGESGGSESGSGGGNGGTEPGGSEDPDPANSIGAGITVVVLSHHNQAGVVKVNTIEADSIDVAAISGLVYAAAIAKAGHVSLPDTSKLGLGGAIAVQVTTVKNEAFVEQGLCKVNGGSVLVVSTGTGVFATVADASGKYMTSNLAAAGVQPSDAQNKNLSSMGIGAGVAVAVTGVDATAVFAGELAGNVAEFTVKSDFALTEEVYSAAGAAGGKSVVPVLSLSVSGLFVEAEAGGTGEVAVLGNMTVNAKGKAKRTLTADAAAIGGSVGVGASFGISILNDSAIATLARSVTANNVFVDAESVSRLKETIKASAKGAQPKESPNAGKDAPTGATEEDLDKQVEVGKAGSADGDISHLYDPEQAEADKFADKNTEAAGNMANRTNTKNVNKTAVDNLSKDRQRAETSEGNVQVAAAMALNIHNNVSLAQILDGLKVVAQPVNGQGGEIAVRSLNDTDAAISANASATNSTTGVGVAVAINIVSYENKAYIGDSRLQAVTLTVTAGIVDSNSAETLDRVMQELVKFLKDTYGTDELVKQLLQYQGEDDDFKALVRAHLLTLKDDDGNFIYSQANAEKIAELDAAVNSVDKAVAAVLIEKLMGGQVSDVGGTVLGAVADEFVAQFQNVLQQEDFFKNLIFNLKDGNNANPFQGIVDSITQAGKAAGELADMLVRAMAIRSGSNDELDGLGHRISSQAISGVGAANVGVAGSLALSVVNGKTEAVIAAGNNTANDIVVDGDVVISADGTQKVHTTSSASADKKGMAEKNKTGSGEQKKDGTSVGIGASVAISIVNVTVTAALEGGRNLTAGTLQVLANARSDVDTISVAGSDPIERRTEIGTGDKANNTSTKDIAVDASVALTILTNTITARVAAGTTVDLTKGGNTIETGVETNNTKELVNLYVAAVQRGETYTAASGFVTAGKESKAAVGAAVAVNLAVSDVQAIFAGTGLLGGIAKIYARTYDRDEAAALATVSGNSLDRYLDKLNSIEKWLNNPGGSGGQGSGSGSSKPNKTSSSIVEKLNQLLDKLNAEKQGEKDQGGQTEPDRKAEEGQPLMSNVLGKLGVKTPGLPDTSKADDKVKEHGDTDATGQPYDETAEKGQSINIAAAVAVNVTKHAATASITGTLQATAIRLLAENNGNFRTLATGATIMPGSQNANCISAAVAVTVNNNEAKTQAGGKLTATNGGEIAIHSELTQNMDKPYNGLLGAQALAGSVSGNGGKVGLAGAVAIMVAHAKTQALVDANSVLTGGAISVTAQDKSKFAVRAGAITVTGSAAGVGASFALVYARSETLAKLGDGTTVNAASLKLLAQRVEVNIDDYEFPFDVTDLVTVQEKGKTFTGNKGLVHIVANTSDDQEAKTGDEDTVQLNLGVDDLLKVADMLNFLGSVNYYLEAIAGSVVTGQDAKAAFAGSVALAFLWNKTSAQVGDDVTINLSGDMDVTAKSDGKLRLIGGAVSFSTGKASVGVNAAGMYYDDEVTAQVGNRPNIDVGGKFNLNAHAGGDIWSVTVAAAVKTGATGAAIGGNLNAIITNNKVAAKVLDGQDTDATAYGIKAGGPLNITANNKAGIVNIAVSLAVSTAVAAGGTVSVIVTQNETVAAVGKSLSLQGQGIKIDANSEEKLINILASVSGSTQKAAVAGTLGVLVSLSDTSASVGDGSKLDALAGDAQITASADVWQLVIMAAVAGSGGGAAVGATVNVGVFNRDVSALVGKNVDIKAGGNILIEALAEDWNLYVTMAGGATTGNVAVAGAIPVVVSLSSVTAELGQKSKAVAGGSVAVIAHLDAKLYNIAGSVSISGGSAVGATVSTIVINNSITASVHDYATIVGKANAASQPIQLPNRTEKRRGVIVSATAGADLVMVSVSGAVGTGPAAVVGVVNTLVVTNKVQALVGRHVAVNADPNRNADGSIPDATGIVSGAQVGQTVLVEADDDSHIYNIAGGVAISGGTAGVGATVVTMVYNKLVRAAVGVDVTDPDDDGSAAHTGVLFARSGVDVLATNDDFVVLVAINCGVGSTAGVSIGAVVLVFNSLTEARLGGKVVAGTQDGDTAAYVNVKAATGMGQKPGQGLGVDLPNLIVVAVVLAGGGTAGVAPVGTVTYYEGTTRAALNDNADVFAKGDVSIVAQSKEYINSNAVGIAIGGTAGVAGTVNIILTELTVEAITGSDVKIKAANLTIDAKDDYKLLGIAGTIAAGGTAAVGITGIVSILHNTVQAGIGANSNVTTTATGQDKGVSIQAESLRNAVLMAANASLGFGGAGVGINLMVMVAGGMLTQDSSDSLKQGFATPREFLDQVKDKSHSSAADQLDGRGEATEAKLAGDGNEQSKTQAGHQEDGKYVFDGADGYRSDEFDNESYNDDNGGGRGSEHKLPGDDDGKGGTVAENQDYENAANLGGKAPTYIPKDTTKAYIGAGATVTSEAAIQVLASDRLTADLLTATVAGGAYAGVGVGVAVAVLFSNVLAQVEDGAELSAKGNVTVGAYAGSTPESLAANDEWRMALEGSVNGKDAKDEEKFSFPLRSIRAISIVFSGGFVGVAGAVASVNLFTNVKATMAGDVLKAANLNVSAVSDYPAVLALTLAGAGGAVAVNASVALTIYGGTVEASVCGSAKIGQQAEKGTVGNITVESNSTSKAVAIATAFGGGIAAINGGVALAVNRTRVDTFIGQGVKAKATGTVTVSGTATTEARVAVMGVAIAGIAINIGVAIAIVAPTVYTYIGSTPADNADDVLAHSVGTGGLIDAKDVIIKNEIKGTATALVIAAGLALGSANNFNVLLVFNRTQAFAGIHQANVTASDTIDVDAYMDTSGRSFVGSVAIGLAQGGGVTVSYVQLRAVNRAIIDVTDSAVTAKSITVNAGTAAKQTTSEASAMALALTGGLFSSANYNVAIVDNNTRNTAGIAGNKKGILKTTGALDVLAYGKATAQATLVSVTLSGLGVGVAASVAVAVLRSQQSAEVKGGSLDVGSLKAESRLNQPADGSPDGESDTARVELVTDSLGLANVNITVAVAYGRSASRAIVAPDSLKVGTVTAPGAITIGSYGHAGVTSKVTNASVSAVGVGFINAFAFAQATFEAWLDLPAGSEVSAGNIAITTQYLARAKVDLTPAAGGVSAGLVKVASNLAVAKADSTAAAGIRGKGTITKAGTIKAEVTGKAVANAIVTPPTVTVGVANLAANITLALLTAIQEARIEGVRIVEAGNITVTSTLNNGTDEGAVAKLGLPETSSSSVEGKKDGGGNISISLVGGKANSSTALANATSRAIISQVAIAKAGALTVTSTGKSYADATVPQDKVNVGAVSIGITVLYAKANGTYEAIIDTTGVEMNASSASVTTTYTAQANAVMHPANGGSWAVSGASATTNVASATVGVKANAKVTADAKKTNKGSLLLTGALTIWVTGNANAVAEIPGTTVSISGVNMAVNIVTATLGAVQNAAIENTRLVEAASLSIQALFNKSNSKWGATATVGSNGSAKGVAVTLVGGEVSKATASMNATVQAYAKDAGLTVGGAIDVLADAISYAKADLASASTSVSLANVSLMHTTANAAGTFAAYIDAGNADVTAGSVSVKVNYKATAEASTGPAGGLGISLMNAAANKASASTGLNAQAGFAGNGKIHVKGNLNVKAIGTGSATAIGRDHNITISGVNIAVNEVSAVLNAIQKAYVAASQANEESLMRVDGNIVVDSQFGTASEQGSAEAKVGGAGNVALSLLSATTNKATASVETINEAFISNSKSGASVPAGVAQAASASVVATSHTYSKAEARDAFNISLATYGGLEAKATTSDVVKAYVEQVSLTLAGKLDILATGNSEAYALATSPGSVNVAEVAISTSTASVGTSSKSQRVQAYIGTGANIRLNGQNANLRVLAVNTGKANAESKKGTSVSLGRVDKACIQTYGYYTTEAFVANGAQVWVGGTIEIRAFNDITSLSEVSGRSIGFAVAVANMKGNNTVTTNSAVSVGTGAKVFAAGNVLIEAISIATMKATSDFKSGGFIDKVTVTATNTLNRYVSATIAGNALVESDYGSVYVYARSGHDGKTGSNAKADNIVAYAASSGTGFVAFSKSAATNEIINHVTSEVHRGAEIRAYFGTVAIHADGSITFAYAYAYAYGGAVGVEPTATATNRVYYNTRTLIGENNGSGMVLITAAHVDIRSLMAYLYVDAEGYARGRGLGVNVKGYGNVYMYSLSNTGAKTTNPAVLETRVSNAVIRGYQSVGVRSVADPNWRRGSLLAEGYGFAQGIGRAEGHAYTYGGITNRVYLGPSLDIYSADIYADAHAFSGDVDPWGHTRRTGIASAGDYGNSNDSDSIPKNIKRELILGGVNFYLGGGAAGVRIDIAEDGTVRTQGLADPSVVQVLGTKVTVGHIANALPGRLILGKPEASPQVYKIYGGDMLYEVIIINRSEMDVVLEGITLQNNNMLAPYITIGGQPYTGNVETNRRENPLVRMETRTTANVEVTGLIGNRFGLVQFVWTEYINFTNTKNPGGNLTSVQEVALLGVQGGTVAPVWAARLEVENAANIGKNSSSRFVAWLFAKAASGNIPASIQTNGNCYLMLSPALFEEVSSLPISPSTDPFVGHQLQIESLRAGGTNDLRIGQGLRVYGLKGSPVVSVPLPGRLEYVSGVLKDLSTNVTLDSEALQRYRTGYDPVGKYGVYELPNGTLLYIDDNGQLLRVVEYVNGVAVDMILEMYNFRTVGGVKYVDIGEGVSLNLSNGRVEVKEGYAFEALLSSVKADWILSNVGTGNFKFVYYVDGYATMKEGGLTHWKTVGSVNYYYITGHKPTAADLNKDNPYVYYILTIDTSSNTMAAYELAEMEFGNQQNDPHSSSYEDDIVANYDKTYFQLMPGFYLPLFLLTGDENDLYYVISGNASIQKADYFKIANFGGTQLDVFVVYNHASQGYSWLMWPSASSGPVILDITYDSGTSLFSVAPGAASGNATVRAFYNALQGVYWSASMVADKNYNGYNPSDSIWTGENHLDFKGYAEVGTDKDGNVTSINRVSWANSQLYTRYIELNYWKLTPVSMLVTPEYTDDGTLSHYQVDFYDEYDPVSHKRLGYSNIAFEGPISGIQMKTNKDLGVDAYRITEQLYVSTGGVVMMKQGSFIARYDGSSYISNYLTASNTPNLSSVQLTNGIPVKLERLSNDVAVDVQGRYWFLSGNTWVQATKSTSNTTTTVTLPNGTVLTGVALATTTVSYGGQVRLTIETLTHSSGFELMRITLPNGTVVDSDGNVSLSSQSAISMLVTQVAGKTTLINHMEGEDVVVVLDGPADSLADGRTAADTAPNIAAGKGVTFVSNSTGSIGTAAKPIDMVLGGTLHFFDRSDYDFALETGSRTLCTNSWLRVPTGNVQVADNTTLAAKRTLNLETKSTAQDAGNITFGNLTAKEGSKLTFRASGTIKGTKLTAGGAANGVAAGATISFTAAKDIGVTDVVAGSKSDVTFLSSGGSIVSSTLNADGSKVGYTADKDILVDAVTAKNGSEVSFTANKGNIVSDTLNADNSTVEYTAEQDVLVDAVTAENGSEVSFVANKGKIVSDTLDAKNSIVDYTAYGDIQVTTTDAQKSTVSWTATGDGDIRFDIIEAKGSKLALRAKGGGIYTLQDTSYLWADEDCANPVLSAKEDIGTPARRLIVDIPAKLWLIVERVRNYYIDAVELEGVAFKRTRPVIVPGSGRDEEGEHRDGDWLADADDQLILLALDKQSPEELAGWITSLMARADWAALLDAGVLAWLIEEKYIDEGALASLLVDDNFTQQDLQALLNSTAPDRFDVLAAMLLPVLAKPVLQPTDSGYDPDEKTVEDLVAAAWLEEGIRGGKLANLADVLTKLLTPAEIQALIDKAWAEEADYAGHASNKPDDVPGRAFFMEIGYSDGAGWLHNVGDITVVQKDGEMGLGSIVSRRGNITLTAENGGMWGEAGEPIHVDGWDIGLHAKGDIGSAQQPVVTEQRSNRIVQVGNVIKPTKDIQDVWHDLVLTQVQKTDEHGQPVFDQDNKPVMEWVLEIVIRYSWIRVYFPEEATRLDLTSTEGGAWIVENSGDGGLGVVNTKGHFDYNVPGSILDTRTAAQKAPNITAGTARLIARQGTIGESALRDADGTLVKQPVFIETDVAGLTEATAKGSVHISDRADLLLAVDSEDGQVYAKAAGGIELYNTEDADLILGYVLAGGDVKITGERSVIPGDKLDEEVFVRGKSISITAKNGTVGVESNPMLVDTNAAAGGTLSAKATDTIYLVEHSGDVTVGLIHGGADVTLIVPGSIVDLSKDDWAKAAAEAVRKAAEAESLAESIRTVEKVLRDYIENGRLAHDNGYGDAFDAMRDAQRAKAEAEKARDALLQQINDLQNGANPNQAYIAQLQGKVNDLNAEIAGLAQEATAQEAIWRNALAAEIANIEAALQTLHQEAQALESAAAQSRQDAADAEAAIQTGQKSITAAGDLTLVAGGSVGRADNWMDIDAGGVVDVTIGTNSDLFLSSAGPLTLANPVEARHVGLAAEGSLVIPTDKNGYAIQAQTANLQVLNGDIGSKAVPMRTAISELTALADNVYINNTGDLTLHSVIAKQEVEITTSGSLLAGDAGTNAGNGTNPNVIAQDATLRAGGSIGDANKALGVDVHTLTASAGKDIYLISYAEDFTIKSMSAGGTVDIKAVGRVLGGPIYSAELVIIALGDVGEELAPLIYTAGKSLLVSILGWVYGVRLTFPGPGPVDEEEEPPVPPSVPRRRFFGRQEELQEEEDGGQKDNNGQADKPKGNEIPVGPKKEDEQVKPCSFPCLIPILLMLILLLIMLFLWLRERKKRKELEERVTALEAPARPKANVPNLPEDGPNTNGG